jgi:hypothetical protein
MKNMTLVRDCGPKTEDALWYSKISDVFRHPKYRDYASKTEDAHVIRSFLIFSKIKISETTDRSPHFDTIKQYKCLYFESSSIKEFNFMRLASLVSKGSGIRFRIKLRHSTSVFCLRSVMRLRMFNAQCSMLNVQCSMFNAQCSMFKYILRCDSVEH